MTFKIYRVSNIVLKREMLENLFISFLKTFCKAGSQIVSKLMCCHTLCFNCVRAFDYHLKGLHFCFCFVADFSTIFICSVTLFYFTLYENWWFLSETFLRSGNVAFSTKNNSTSLQKNLSDILLCFRIFKLPQKISVE